MIVNYAVIFFTVYVVVIGMCHTVFKQAAITANGKLCAMVGRRIMQKGGSVADAAIATMLCDGVACSERMGLGGGFAMTMYHRATRKVEILLAREVAPLAAHKNMFNNKFTGSLYGGLAVAVPGELKGYWELHQKYGKLPWAELFDAAINLCTHGTKAEPFVARCLKEYETMVMNSPSLRCVFGDFCNSFSGGKPKIYRPKLARTLGMIAKEGPNVLYNGTLTDGFLEDIRKHGGIITKEDMTSYKPHWMEPSKVKMRDNMTIYSMPPPGSGSVLLLILNILSRLAPIHDKNIALQYVIESFKFAFGYRTQLGDGKFAKNVSKVVDEILSDKTADVLKSQIVSMKKTNNDSKHYGGKFMNKNNAGTCHLNFVHPNGDAIAATSTVNSLFGAMFRSDTTGIILNSHMNDFSLPEQINRYGLFPSPANFIEPRKTPMSSICPTIVLDHKSNVRMVVGAAGGTRIISAVAMVMFQNLLQKENINKAISSPRIHHQLLPMTLHYEKEFDEHQLDYLKSCGHQVKEFTHSSTVSAIVRDDKGELCPAGDYRRCYSTDGY